MATRHSTALRRWYVYVLIDPETLEVRYVGVTVRGIRLRLNEHVSRARRGGRSYRDNWLRQLLRKGKRPILWPIDIARDDWVESEREWIAFYLAAGCRLTNLTDGGEGNSGYVPSPELRALWSAQRRGKKYAPGRRSAMLGKHHPPEVRELISEAGRGRHHTEASRAKLSAAHKGKVLSPEHVEKMARAKRGKKLTPEHRAKISASTTSRRPVRQLSTGHVFPSVTAAALAMGVRKVSINQALYKRCRCKGSYWEYAGG